MSDYWVDPPLQCSAAGRGGGGGHFTPRDLSVALYVSVASTPLGRIRLGVVYGKSVWKRGRGIPLFENPDVRNVISYSQGRIQRFV